MNKPKASSSRTLPPWLTAALPSVAYGIGVWYASKALLKLSGNALWLPLEWRRTVEVLGVMFGVLLFGLAAHATDRARAKSGAGDAHEAEARAAHVKYKRAVAYMGGALVALFLYVALRQATVIDWTPPPWYVEDHRGRPLPPFVDLEAGTIFLPLVWPEELERQAEATRQLPDFYSTPIHYLLSHAPQQLIDVVEANAKGGLLLTTWLFLALHLTILAFTSLALGSSFTVAGAIGKLFTSH
jgi:hypothetical protein